MPDPLEITTAERQLLDCLPARELLVSLSVADERRLERACERFNRECEDIQEQLFPDYDQDLAIMLMAAASTGLDLNEHEDGIWTDNSGYAHALPRTRRLSWHLRLKLAWRSAQLSWRST